MQPAIHLNWAAIVVAIIASWLIGGLWYGPLFGAAWKRAMGYPADMKPMQGEVVRSMALNIFGTFLTAFVLSHDVQVWRPSSWNAGTDQPPYVYGFFGGFFNWLGFMVPVLLNSVAFERKSWKLFWINAAYLFVSLQVIGMILSYWR